MRRLEFGGGREERRGVGSGRRLAGQVAPDGERRRRFGSVATLRFSIASGDGRRGRGPSFSRGNNTICVAAGARSNHGPAGVSALRRAGARPGTRCFSRTVSKCFEGKLATVFVDPRHLIGRS